MPNPKTGGCLRPIALDAAEHQRVAKSLEGARRHLDVVIDGISGRVPAAVLDAALRAGDRLATLCLRLDDRAGGGVYLPSASGAPPAGRARRRRGPLTVDDHRAIGAALHGLRDGLLALAHSLQLRYPKASSVGRASRAVVPALDRLRCRLDGLFLRQHPSADDSHVYFPGPAAAANTRHQEAQP